jgi:replicative DNA helicase
MAEVTELEMRSDPAEEALIGAVAHHPDALAGVLAQLTGDAFYKPARGVVWDACRVLSSERKPIDPVTVARQLTATGGLNPATRHVIGVEMSNAAPAVHAAHHAEIVADLARRRELLRTVNRMRGLIADHPGDASEALAAARALLEPLGHAEEHSAGTLSWSQMLDEFEAAHAPGGSRPGIPTPWEELNDLIGGLYGGRLYVVGGSPGDGKSTAALNLAVHAAERGHETLVFSAEMPTLDVFGRIVARGAEVDLRAINQRKLTDWELAKIRDYAKSAGDLPLRVNAEQFSLAGITSLARAHHHRRGLQVLVVDYLQLVSAGAGPRTQEEEIAKISTALKRLSRELDCAVVVPAQLNRNPHARADQRPTKADLRGSGKIEQDADVVILLWHERVDDQRTGNVTLLLDKNRHGPTGGVTLRWHGGYGAIG